jgi:hypothetical protein
MNLGKNLCYSAVKQDANNIRFYINKPTSDTITLSATLNVATSSNSLYLSVDGVSVGRAGIITGDANTRQTSTMTLTNAMMEAIENGSEIYLLLFKSQAGFTEPIDAQVELGDQATPYSPYKTPIELAKIGTYQDYIWNDGGTWKIHKEVGKVVATGTLDSNLNWYAQAEGSLGRFYSTILSDALYTETKTEIIATHFHFTTTSELGACYLYKQRFYAFYGTSATTASDFKTWLASNNTTFYFALATPTDTAITDSDLIEQLNHIYSLYGGVNNLWLIPSGGEQGEI